MGKIVWWGMGDSLADTHLSKATNGVLEINKEMTGDFIAIAARRGNGLWRADHADALEHYYQVRESFDRTQDAQLLLYLPGG